jgi:hypothetical protein
MSSKKSEKNEKKVMMYNPVKGLDSMNLSEFAIAPIARDTSKLPTERKFEWYAPDENGKMRRCFCKIKYGLKVPNYKTEEVLMALCFLLLKQKDAGGNGYVLDTSHTNIYRYLNFDASRKPSAKDYKMISDHLDALMDTKIELQYITPDGKFKRLVKSTIVQRISFIDEVSDRDYKKKNAVTNKIETVSKAPKQLESVQFSDSFIDLFMNEVTFFDYYQYLWLQRPIPKRLYRIMNNHKEYGTFDNELKRFCEMQLGMTGASLNNHRDLARRIRKETRIVNSLGDGEFSVVRRKGSLPSGYSIIYSNQPRLFSLSDHQEFWTREEHEAFQMLRSYNLTEAQSANFIRQYRSVFGYKSPDYITYTISRLTKWIDTEVGDQLRVPRNKLCALLINVFKEGWYYKDFNETTDVEPYSRDKQLKLISGMAKQKTLFGTEVHLSLPDFKKVYPKQYNIFSKEIKEQMEFLGVGDNVMMYNTFMENRCSWYANQKQNER